jgi:hypothetical protein
MSCRLISPFCFGFSAWLFSPSTCSGSLKTARESRGRAAGARGWEGIPFGGELASADTVRVEGAELAEDLHGLTANGGRLFVLDFSQYQVQQRRVLPSSDADTNRR